MRKLLAAITVVTALTAFAIIPAHATEATFTRDLNVTGQPDLKVSTGSGSIHLTVGPAGHIHVFGRVKSSWGGSDDVVRDIADHPPIEQTGNIVRIGELHRRLNNISVDYEVQAPAGSFLDASTGSGNITDEGVGTNAKLNTGSGNIHASGLQNGFSVGTGSGNIYADQTGTGEVRAETGSGNIELKSLHGGLHAETGSGNIKADGTPAMPWKLETGSGNVEIWTGNAALTLDAETGSGSITTDREITAQGTLGKHHMIGKISGGGPTVKIETGSGSIRIH